MTTENDSNKQDAHTQTPSNGGSETYAADAPVKNSKNDRFRRWPFAQRIAKVISMRRDPSSIVISINGAWGEGKTTILNFIEEELKQHSHVVCFRFNPWRFTDESKLLLNFFLSLTDAVGRSVPTKKERLGEWVGKYATAAASFFGQGDAVKQVGELLSSVEIEEIRDRVESILKAEGKRVVILMDDIDRLDKHEIQTVFRLVKLSADFSYIAYVLAFDDEMVASALQERYSSNDAEAGRNFLEKIVQVPLTIPAIPNNSLREFCFTSVDQALKDADIQLSENQIQTFVRQFVQSFEIRLQTPRMAKHYGNILAFSLPILKGEVNPIDLMLIEGIRVFYPKLYSVIRVNQDIFLGATFNSYRDNEKQKQRALDIIEDGLKDLKPDERKGATDLLTVLFPRISFIFGGSNYGSEWDRIWSKEQRICSLNYFTRYFSYSVPEGDIADQEVKFFIENVSTSSLEQITEELKSLIGARNADSLIAKLKANAEMIPQSESAKLALALALNGEQYPNPKQLFSFRGAFSQAAILISKLVKNVEDVDNRMKIVEGLLQIANPIPFSQEIYRWLHSNREDEPKIFTDEQFESLGRIIVSRIQEKLKDGPPVFEQFPENTPGILTTWASWGSKSDASQYVEQLINEDILNTLKILVSFTPTAWSMDSGIAFKSDFERDQYNSIKSVINPDIIYQALQKIFGSEIEVENYTHDDEGPLPQRVALQFAWLHRKIREEQTAKENWTIEGIESQDNGNQ